MTIILDDEVNFLNQNELLYQKIESVIKACLEEEQVPYEVEISLSIVNLQTIQHINKEHRQIDSPTDVLSFPQIEPVKIGTIDWDALDFSTCVNYDTEELMLGDIIICSEKVIEQAKNYEHSIEREICFLVAHSMLHLLGYDHMTRVDEKIMFAKQDAILYHLGILR